LPDTAPQTPEPATSASDPRTQEAIRLAQAGAMREAEALFREVLAEWPDDYQILNSAGAVTARQGRLVEAYPLFQRALALAPDDPNVIGNLAAAKKGLEARANDCLGRGDLPGARQALRDILTVEPTHQSAPNILIHCLMYSGGRAELADFAPELSEAELGRHIFIACMPKSGSTFLKHVLCALTGWREATLTYAFLQNEEELYLPHLRAVASADTVTQQHCRATVPNVQLMQAFAIRPIVLVRNLFDAVVSYTDFFDNGATVNTFFQGRWDSLERERRIDLIIDHFVPWYLGFYVSWTDAMARGQLDCMLLRYEDMIADKPGTLERLADFYGLDIPAAECAAAVAAIEGDPDKAKTRFNKGKAGRGEELSEAQTARIRALAGYYHDVDFAPIGL
jgi:Sulfotransferase domain